MAFQIQFRTKQGGAQEFVDKNPDECPICHVVITPVSMGVDVQNLVADGPLVIERVMMCPNEKCGRLFIARYLPTKNPNQKVFDLHTCVPVQLTNAAQSEIITKLSHDFCAIYKQAHQAEQHGLDLIAGPGYRKALEFLIKDYIISGFTEKDEALAAKKTAVEKTLLGACIAAHIKSEQIKEIAKRAAWLGNDETHYVRKWEDKDLQDLKKLIKLTLHWIEMETLTGEVIADMPEGKT
jgi:hypothetical protein